MYFILARLRRRCPPRAHGGAGADHALSAQGPLLPGPEHEGTLLARIIEAKDRQIDRLVYELDGLTEEVWLVEGGGEWLPGEHFPKIVK